MTTAPEYPVVPLTGLVHDNSETVTDYAFTRHRSPGRGVVTVKARDNNLGMYDRGVLIGTVHTWYDTNQLSGQRGRFDKVVRDDGTVVHLFHTEYFTRVACGVGDWCHSYATHYTVVVDEDGKPSDKVPYCDEHLHDLRRNLHGLPMRLHLSERLFVGQHD